jgi:hypothetical protein
MKSILDFILMLLMLVGVIMAFVGGIGWFKYGPDLRFEMAILAIVGVVLMVGSMLLERKFVGKPKKDM